MKTVDDFLEKFNAINKILGKEAVVLAQDFKVDKLSTGSLSLDNALGGGWPFGRIVTLWGPKDSTKSSLALLTIANAQKNNYSCIYINAEGSFDSLWAEKNGVDISKLAVWKANSFEQLSKGLRPVIMDSIFNVIVIDSITSLGTDKDFEEGDNSMAQHARGMSPLLKKFVAWQDFNTLIILISQQRKKLAQTYIENIYTGGSAVDHYSSVIVRIQAGTAKEDKLREKITSGNKVLDGPLYGQKIYWKLQKSKVSEKDVEGHYIFKRKGGIDTLSEIIQLAILRGVVEVAGPWIKYNEKNYQGVERFKDELTNDSNMLGEITSAIS